MLVGIVVLIFVEVLLVWVDSGILVFVVLDFGFVLGFGGLDWVGWFWGCFCFWLLAGITGDTG